MVELGLALILGGVLAAVGAVICLYWYVYWQRNFEGQLLTEGPYAVVRHPFYTGFILLALGLAIVIPIFETRMLAVMTLAVMTVFVPREEEQLIKQYKKKYRDYMEKVKWRLIPLVY